MYRRALVWLTASRAAFRPRRSAAENDGLEDETAAVDEHPGDMAQNFIWTHSIGTFRIVTIRSRISAEWYILRYDSCQLYLSDFSPLYLN